MNGLDEGLYSAEFKAELLRPAPHVVPLLELDPPSGPRRWSKSGVCSYSRGPYEPRVKSFGTVRPSISDRQNSLVGFEAAPVLNDHDMLFRRIVGAGEDLTGSPMRMWLASINVPVEKWYLAFSGVLYDYQQTTPGEIALKGRPDDEWLSTKIPRWAVSEADWPKADRSVLGRPYPIPYGLHDSTSSRANRTSDGALPTLLVDTQGWVFLVCIGWIDVRRVYVSGALRTAGFAVLKLIRNGRPFTVIDFAADPGGPVTVDAYGYDDVGDGTGRPILNPAQQIAHLLAHVAYRDSLGSGWTGRWPAVEVPLEFGPVDFSDSYGYVERLASGGAYGGGIYLDQTTTAYDVLNTWAAEDELKPYWLPQGTLHLAPDDMALIPRNGYYDPTMGDHWARYQDFRGPLRIHLDSQDSVRQIQLKLGRIAAQNKTFHTLDVFDSLSKARAVQSIQMVHGPGGE